MIKHYYTLALLLISPSLGLYAMDWMRVTDESKILEELRAEFKGKDFNPILMAHVIGYSPKSEIADAFVREIGKETIYKSINDIMAKADKESFYWTANYTQSGSDIFFIEQCLLFITIADPQEASNDQYKDLAAKTITVRDKHLEGHKAFLEVKKYQCEYDISWDASE